MVSATVSNPAGDIVETYTYDYLGNRTSKTSNGVTTKYTTDLSSGYAQVLKAEKDSEVTYYTRGFELISKTTNGETVFYLYYGGSSVRALTYESGAVTDTLVFDAFGNETDEWYKKSNPFEASNIKAKHYQTRHNPHKVGEILRGGGYYNPKATYFNENWSIQQIDDAVQISCNIAIKSGFTDG